MKPRVKLSVRVAPDTQVNWEGQTHRAGDVIEVDVTSSEDAEQVQGWLRNGWAQEFASSPRRRTRKAK